MRQFQINKRELASFLLIREDQIGTKIKPFNNKETTEEQAESSDVTFE